MKIGAIVPVNSGLWSAAIDGLRRRFPKDEFIVGEETALRDLEGFDAIVASKLSVSTLSAASSLKALFLPITGANGIPAALLASRGVKVFNVHANAESVAQNALAMILAWFGRTIEFHNDLRSATWHGFWVGRGAEDEWDTIFDRRVAILGTGAIGSALASLLAPFRCQITGWRRHAERPQPLGFDRMETSLEAVVTGCDIVVAALPLTTETQGIIAAPAFAAMRGAFFVNVGRGATVDEEALWLALRDRSISGAGLDVWYRYPQGGATQGAPSRFPIHELPNVILSPHVGGSTRQASRAAIEATCANLASWLERGESENAVDLSATY
ncbi:MAG TPA: 2-hydroxyacid dehydrogenase [Rectinemataceae bacterium]|nr:2-hydroxyacid dehydrogenase [Rectinemataceae bacterium]